MFADFILWVRVWIVRRLLIYNDAQERAQNPQPPVPTFSETIPSSSSRGSVRLHYHYPPGTSLTSSSPAKTKHPIVIDFHGGGFSSGVPSMDDRWIASLHTHATTQPVVVGVDYSLAPEHPFPAAIQDAAAAISYLSTHGAATHSLDPSRLVLAGWSAGATLALTSPLWIHEHPDSLPRSPNSPSETPDLRGILAIYPQTDYRIPRPSPSLASSSRLVNFLNETWDLAFPRRVNVESPFISPAAATDDLLRSGLPDSIALYTVADDPLCARAETFRTRLRGLGKRVGGDVEPGVGHAWDKSPIPHDSRGVGGDEAGNDAIGREKLWKKREEWFARIAKEVDTMLR